MQTRKKKVGLRKRSQRKSESHTSIERSSLWPPTDTIVPQQAGPHLETCKMSHSVGTKVCFTLLYTCLNYGWDYASELKLPVSFNFWFSKVSHLYSFKMYFDKNQFPKESLQQEIGLMLFLFKHT